MGPMKGAWNSRDKCAERGLEVKWGTHWCPAVDMACEVPGCLRHDRKTGALKTFTSGAWAVQETCESKNAAPRWTTACERRFYRAHARDSSPAPRSLRGPLAPPRFSPARIS